LAFHADNPPPTPDILPLAAVQSRRRRKKARGRGAVARRRAQHSLLRATRYAAIKAAIEFAAALVLVVLAAPIIAVAAVLIKLTSHGPAFYTQARVGKNGRPFTIYKLRTMIHDCESLTGPRWAIRGDPRVTPVGQFLRASHLDELPQLLNVLLGNMGLIGPRPERPEFVRQLEQVVPGYRQRLAVRPGVTGLAQVQLGADTDVASVRRKVLHDCWYIEHLGPWMDLRLLLATGLYVLGNPLGLTRRLRLVPSRYAIEGAEHEPTVQLPNRLKLSA
jgi:lipopolysaccharide/colanic/teichoic acid biosynthesis glycosyltransferase